MKLLNLILLIKIGLNVHQLFSCETFNTEPADLALQEFRDDFKQHSHSTEPRPSQPKTQPFQGQGQVLPFNPPPLPPETPHKKFIPRQLSSNAELATDYDNESGSVVIINQQFLSWEKALGRDFIKEGDDEQKADRKKILQQIAEKQAQLHRKQKEEQYQQREQKPRSLIRAIAQFLFR